MLLYVVSREGPVSIGRSCHNRAEAHRHTRFVCPVLELPARERNSDKYRCRLIRGTRSRNHHAESRTRRIRGNLGIEARLVENGSKPHVLTRNTHMYGVVAHNSSRIVHPMRKVHARIWNSHSHKGVSLINLNRSGCPKRTNHKGKTPKHRALRYGNFNRIICHKLCIVRHVGISFEFKDGVVAFNYVARFVETPPHKTVALARHGLQRNVITRRIRARTEHPTTARARLTGNNSLRRNRHLVRVGKARLKTEFAVADIANQILIDSKPTMRILTEKRSGRITTDTIATSAIATSTRIAANTIAASTRIAASCSFVVFGLYQIPTHEALAACRLSVQLHCIAEFVGTRTLQRA